MQSETRHFRIKFPFLLPTTLSEDGKWGKIMHSTFILQVARATPGASAPRRASPPPQRPWLRQRLRDCVSRTKFLA